MKEQDMPATAAPPGATRPTAPDTLTKSERVFFQILSDGRPHGPDELTRGLWEELAANLRVSIGMHVSRMRVKLLPLGLYIVAVPVDGRCHYAMISR